MLYIELIRRFGLVVAIAVCTFYMFAFDISHKHRFYDNAEREEKERNLNIAKKFSFLL